VLTAIFYAGYMLAIKSASERTGTASIMAVSTSVAASPASLRPCHRRCVHAAVAKRLAGPAWPCTDPAYRRPEPDRYGFAHLPAAFSSVSLLLQPVLAAIYAWALLGEAVGPMQTLGGLVSARRYLPGQGAAARSAPRRRYMKNIAPRWSVK